VRNARSRRTRLVAAAERTWANILDLPFAERIFIDDGSPGALGTATLCSTGLHRAFDRIEYNARQHPPHSNFGIIESLSVPRTRFILHIDDDIRVSGSRSELQSYLGECLTILARDPAISGINILTFPESLAVWAPFAPYESDPRVDPAVKLSHPKKFFGTAACVIRAELLDRYPRERVYADGEQTLNWERLVSTEPTEFLVDCVSSPFSVDPSAYKQRATYRWSARRALKDRARTVKRTLLRRPPPEPWNP
jgi:hypothetical protein